MATLFNSIPKALRRVVLNGVIFVILIALFLLAASFRPAATATQSVQSRLASVGTSINTFLTQLTTSEESLQSQHNYYQSLAGELAIETSYVQQLESEIDELTTLLGYTASESFTSTTARIVSRSATDDRAVLIDKGTDNGLQVGMAVVVEEGHLVGTIEEADAHQARVLLLEDPDSRIPSAILGSTKTIGLVEGQDGFLLHMEFIPQDERVEVNDVVVTSGLEGALPSGLVIGTVSSIVQDESASFQEAFIEPIFDVSAQSFVLVIHATDSSLIN